MQNWAVIQAKHTLNDICHASRKMHVTFTAAVGGRWRFVVAQINAESGVHLRDSARNLHCSLLNAFPDHTQTIQLCKAPDFLQISGVGAIASNQILARKKLAQSRRS
jgi:hypothetical protein